MDDVIDMRSIKINVLSFAVAFMSRHALKSAPAWVAPAHDTGDSQWQSNIMY